MIILEAKALSKSYQIGPRKLDVLSDINLQISQGDFITIMGPSGSGKSTLLNIFGTLDTPDSGELTICSENPFKLNDRSLSTFRNRHIGFVFQFHHLLPEFNARENVLIPSRILDEKIPNEKKADELLDYFGLIDRKDHFPSQLSGGERQRLALCRALINNPDLLLADEPTGNLDTENAEKMIDYLNQIRSDLKQTILITTHNPKVAGVGNVHLILENGTPVPNNRLDDE